MLQLLPGFVQTPQNVDPTVSDYYIFVNKVAGTGRTQNISLPVRVLEKNKIILIQTDKPIYKSGETGRNCNVNSIEQCQLLRFVSSNGKINCS